eukprot:4378275-Pleurochrysis_carterae.AAC.1
MHKVWQMAAQSISAAQPPTRKCTAGARLYYTKGERGGQRTRIIGHSAGEIGHSVGELGIQHEKLSLGVGRQLVDSGSRRAREIGMKGGWDGPLMSNSGERGAEPKGVQQRGAVHGAGRDVDSGGG